MKNQRIPLAAGVFGLAICAIPAAAQTLGPTPYLSKDDGPFDAGSLVYFHLEDNENGKLDTPGVAAIGTGGPYGPSAITDSVDADDGVIDGKGTGGWSWFDVSGQTGFTFDASALGGHLPTHVGIVWTDAGQPVTFEAYDATGALIGTVTGSSADGDYYGGTAEDRFYGVISAGGVKSIKIRNAGGGLEVDHLQYGYGDVVCKPDCNKDGKLNVNDFICMQAKWRARDAYGDYDGSGTYTVNDFIRFQAGFAKGCG